MGGDQSSPDNEADMADLKLSKEELQQVQKSQHKPSPLYAKLSNKVPAVLPAVEKVRTQLANRKNKIDKPDGSTEVLPLYQMVSAPDIYYKGAWKGGKQHGRGEVFTKGGIYFVGNFVEGSAECEDGLVIFQDGSYYKGNFKDSSFNGEGEFHYAKNGMVYKGQWQNDKPHGHGKETYADEAFYEGAFEFGLKQGYGTFKWKNGKTYKGEFDNGEMHGQGVLSFPDKRSRFEGRFQHGEKVQGELLTEYGRYQGKFLNGLMHDREARFTWHDNKVYVGGFEFGQMHDRRGTLTLSNGEVVQGAWERGENVSILTLADGS